MTERSISAVTNGLMQLLTEERALLRAGRARETTALSVEKLRLLTELEAVVLGNSGGRISHADVRAIEAVKGMASENAVHIEAVQHGVRALAVRLESLTGSESVGAYDKRGARLPFSGGNGQYSNKV